jgi:hypothetical protein
VVTDVDKIQRRILDLVEIQKVYYKLLDNSDGVFSDVEFIKNLIGRTDTEISYYETFITSPEVDSVVARHNKKIGLSIVKEDKDE